MMSLQIYRNSDTFWERKEKEKYWIKQRKQRFQKIFKLGCSINRKVKSGRNIGCEQYNRDFLVEDYDPILMSLCDTCKNRIE